MAKPDSNFVYYVTKKVGRNKLWKCVRVKCAPCYVRKGPVLRQRYTNVQEEEEEGSIVNEYNALSTMNRKTKTCNEIGMLPSV
jgi:hypothetical protein